MNTLLVTGGAGFIGSNFLRYWRKRYPQDQLVVLDRLSYAGCSANLSPLLDQQNCILHQGNINDQELVETLLRQYNVNWLVNFAAESHVDRSLSDPDAFINNNTVGTHSLLKAAQKVWLAGQQSGSLKNKRFHQISTDEVFGDLAEHALPSTEQSSYRPSSPYSASKAAADHLVQAYQRSYGLPTSISICSNNYGPYQHPEKLIPHMLCSALLGRPLPIYGSGLQSRDWLHVSDHCLGIDAVLRRGSVGSSYILGSRNEWQNIQLVQLLCQLIDQAFSCRPQLGETYPNCPAAQNECCAQLIQTVADRAGHDQRYAVNPAKAEKTLGFSGQIQFLTGLKEYVEWYLQRPQWWQPLIADATHKAATRN